MIKLPRNNSFIFAFVFLSLFFLSFLSVFGIEINTPDTISPTSTSIQVFLVKFYEFSIIIGGVAAVLIIASGAVYFTFFAGILKKQQGLDMVWGALWGLLLLFGAYLILKTINPDIVQIRNPGEGIIKEVGAPKKINTIVPGNIEIVPENK